MADNYVRVRGRAARAIAYPTIGRRIDTTDTPAPESDIPLTGLEAWFKYDEGVPALGEPIVTWEDQSGEENNLTVANGTATVAADKIVMASDLKMVFATPLDLPEWECFCVGKFDGAGGAIVLNNSPGTGGWRYWYIADNGTIFIWNQTAFDNLFGPASPYDVQTLYSIAGNADNLWIGVNGTEVEHANSGSEHNIIINVGGKAGQELGGDMYELIIYSRRLTTEERTEVLDYLNTKYPDL